MDETESGKDLGLNLIGNIDLNKYNREE